MAIAVTDLGSSHVQPPPPGSGKCKHRPVWDKPLQGEIERPAVPLPPAGLFGQAPLPPAALFGAKPAPAPTLSLPDFKQFAPSNPMALDSHMRDVQDQADITAVLKAMGIGTDQG